MRQKRLYLRLTDLAFERILHKNFNQEAGKCIVCKNKLHGNQKRFCSKFCRDMYTNTIRSKHHHYEVCNYDWNHREILLAMKEINLSDYDWKL